MLICKILGEEFRFRTDGDDNYLQELISYICDISERIQKDNENMSRYHIMILSALQIAEELYELKRLQHKDVVDKSDEISTRTMNLIKELDMAMGLDKKINKTKGV